MNPTTEQPVTVVSSECAETVKPGAAGDRGSAPFRRSELASARLEMIRKGGWGNADILLYRRGSQAWVIKDFRARSWFVRRVWSSFLIGREARALRRLRGVVGVPCDAFQLDPFALCYRHTPGLPLTEANRTLLNEDFFRALERVVFAMHERRVVHLDLRYTRNILVTPDGAPCIIDFQSHLGTAALPRCLQNWFRRIDLSGVYKHWAKRHPASFTDDRADLLATQRRWRRLWFWKGMAGIQGWRRLTKRKRLVRAHTEGV